MSIGALPLMQIAPDGSIEIDARYTPLGKTLKRASTGSTGFATSRSAKTARPHRPTGVSRATEPISAPIC